MKRKIKKPNIFKILSVIFIIIFILFIPLITKRLIKITKIECSSQFGQCPDHIAYSLQHIANRNYKDSVKLTKNFLKNDILINDYLIQYKIPSTLKIELNLKKPNFAIKNADNIYYLISKDGQVLSVVNELNLPFMIKNDIKYSTGDFIQSEEKFALQLIQKVAWLYSTKENLYENNILTIKLGEGPNVLFPTQGDIDVLVGSLRLIFSRLNDESEGIRMGDIREIDLRFANPILKKYD